MIELSSEQLAVELDPTHGAEILEIFDRRDGLGLLGHPPFEPREAIGGDLDEAAWTERYRGGWQLLAPNAGNACELEGVRHGFHGRASVDPWNVMTCARDRATLGWSGHGLELTREVAVDGDTLTVGLSWTATGSPAPLIAVEHLVLGRTMLTPGCEILAGAVAHALSETDGPIVPPGNAARWPDVLGARGVVPGTAERGLEPPRAGLTALTGWNAGSATIVNHDRAVRLELSWDPAFQTAAWLWEEIRDSGGVWEHRTELLGFELASVSHTLGLARAVQAGQAWWARSEALDMYRVTLRVRHES